MGKKIRKRKPKKPLKEKPIKKSKKGENSDLKTATPIGITIKKAKPKNNLPKRFKMVEKSFLVGETIIIRLTKNQSYT